MPTKKRNIDFYCELIEVIEAEFGVKWLIKRGAKASISPNHWVPSAWVQAKRLIQQAIAAKSVTFTEEVIKLFDLAADLQVARTLPNYHTAINPAKLKQPDFEKDTYVAHVAAIGTRSAYSVQFIPTSIVSGEKTPDLYMERQGHSFYVECKRKDRYHRIPQEDGTWELLENELARLHAGLDFDYEIVVCAVGSLNADDTTEIVRFATDTLRSGEEGIYSGGVPDCILLIRKAPPAPPNAQGLWIPAWQNPGSVMATVTIGPDEQPRYGPMLRTALYVMDAHKLSQIMNSFNSARTQLPDEGRGIIYLDIDGSNIDFTDVPFYLESIASWIRKRFSPSINTRIAAVIITSGPERIEITEDRAFHRTRRQMHVIRNPHHPLPSTLPLPGE